MGDVYISIYIRINIGIVKKNMLLLTIVQTLALAVPAPTALEQFDLKLDEWFSAGPFSQSQSDEFFVEVKGLDSELKEFKNEIEKYMIRAKVYEELYMELQMQISALNYNEARASYRLSQCEAESDSLRKELDKHLEQAEQAETTQSTGEGPPSSRTPS